MGKSHRKILALFLALCLGLVFVVVRSSGTHNPPFIVTLLTSTNVAGSWIARFAVTNVGKATVVSYGVGEIEMFGQKPLSDVGYRGAIRRLSPGAGNVVEVFVPQRVHRPWRFTCLYARDGLRCRIHDWRWGARVERFIPSFLDLGVPLSVKGTSDWIEK
jgi:hypothetical protein